MTKNQHAVCENLGWTVREYDDGTVELEQFSPAGEDFVFEVNNNNLVDEVRQYADGFDIDDHVLMWLQAKQRGVSGVPSASKLVRDAEAIAEMLDNLADALAAAPPLTEDEAMEDIITYLKAQDEDYFAESGRTKEDVLADTELIDKLTDEHMRCVNRYGSDREWSCADACGVDPGIFADCSDEE